MSAQTSSPTALASSPSALAQLVAPFAVTPSLEGDVLTITITGELDIATVHLLEEAQRSGEGRYRTLRYQLGGLGFMDSAGLRVLLAPAGHVPISQISITDPAPIVRRLLEIRGVQAMIAA